MELAQVFSLISGQPESYAILAVIIIFGWKYFPVLKKKVEMQQSQLEGDIRREKLLQDILNTLVVVNASMKTFATKDDVIDLAFARDKKEPVLNGSGTIAKQGV